MPEKLQVIFKYYISVNKIYAMKEFKILIHKKCVENISCITKSFSKINTASHITKWHSPFFK